MKRFSVLLSLLFAFATQAGAHFSELRGAPEALWIAVKTPTKQDRSRLVDLGVSVEQVIDDTSYGFAPEHIVAQVKKSGFEVTSSMPASNFSTTDFPGADEKFHNYAEQMNTIQDLVSTRGNLVSAFSIGTTLQNRQMWAIRINADAAKSDNPQMVSGKPGIVFMGGHHAREHVSVELPLMYAKYLADNYGKDPAITKLIDTRDIFFIPNVNPDGSEFDIATGAYQMWRKNRNPNPGQRCQGVDLNRNYGYKWGTGGSSTDPCSDIYMGKSAFSENETKAIKAFVEARPNLKVLLSFHTFSELVLYPWGHTYDSITRADDLSAYKTMAETMAGWNRYTPEQSSDLYITSGDTTDWSYGELGIFSFTFELSPRDSFGGGGFYPGQSMIPKAFDDNLKPVLYLIDLADNPKRALYAPETTMFFGR